jgi:penicillin amidase
MARRLLQAIIATFVALILMAMAGACYLRAELRASLPLLDGVRVQPGLSAPVTVSRDDAGIPTITGASRADVARALGFVHAQDRFFQMDLQRRQAAGELSLLVGARAVDADRQARLHRFRHIAGEAYQRTEAEWRAVLDAYAAGVNDGIAALGAPPFEYLVLGATPEPWRPEDAILTVLAMFNTLQGRQAGFEQTVEQLRQAMPDPLVRFLTLPGSDWDALASGAPLVRPPVPGPVVANLRARSAGAGQSHVLNRRLHPACGTRVWGSTPDSSCDADWNLGSNNWAVDAAHSAGGALVANDMHLNLGVPNIWYRASLVFPDPSDPLRPLQLTGITLPGLPTLVVGSNGHVAWGFTNTAGDWSDLIRIEPDPRDSGRYLTPDGPRSFELIADEVRVKGEAPRPLTLRWTIWGPVVWTDAGGTEYAQRWVAHDPDVLAGDLARPERTRTAGEMLIAAAGLGIPQQNITFADSAGRIGWTVAGAIPRRVGLSGSVPESWADGSRRWDGYLAPHEFPRILDPPSGRIWTANAPVVDGAALAAIGDGGYADGIRARLIRDRLMAIDRATARDMLDVQLDDTALFLDRWRTLALAALDSPRAAEGGGASGLARAEFRRLVETTWTGRASIDSVAYRLVRTFRSTVVRTVMTFVTRPASERDPAFDYTRSPRSEGPVWQLVTERPMHLLSSEYDSWDDLLIGAIDAAIAELTEGGRPLSARTWGEANRALVLHPLASAIPLVHRWLNMPAAPLPGDVYTPRAHSPRAGPSERLVVSPGREHEGILHMPTGQSAHPLSPHFDDMQQAWLRGEPVPLLPGPPTHTLTLQPR